MSESKALDVVSALDAVKKVSDIVFVGNGDLWKLLSKASSREQGWMKSCKAMQIDNVGCVVQVTTQQGSNVAESISFVPNVKIVSDINNGNKLVSSC